MDLLLAGSALIRLHQLQSILCFAFFGFSAAFLGFSLTLLVLRLRPWCNCPVCRSYLSSSWASQFPNLSDWYAHLLRSSPTGTIDIHVLGNTVTANPVNVEHMLRTRFDNFPKGKRFSSILGDLLGHGIFNVDGDAWRYQRKMATLELGSVAVRSYAFDIVSAEISGRLLPLLSSAADASGEAAATIDLQDVFRRLAFEAICKLSFGLDPASLNLSLTMSDFAAAFDAASRLSAQRGAAALPAVWRMKRLLSIGSERELNQAVRTVNELAAAIIRERRKVGPSGKHDLLSRFMASLGATDDDKYLRDIVISFLLAGRDTVASGLTTFFLLLSQNPAVVAAIREEIAAFSDEVPGYEQLKRMHYVHAAIYESLRLYPPVQFDSKFCAEDDVLPDGTFVGKGRRVTYHPYAMGRMPSVWGADCEEFRPERWLRNGVFTPECLFKYPVFQAGMRVCLGKELAVMEMKAVAVSVVRSFDVEVPNSGRGPPKFAPGLTATLKGGLPARIRRRTE